MNKYDYFMSIARLVKERSKCVRRKVGCVLVNERSHIVGTGYCGPPSKFPHCTEETCVRKNVDRGTNLQCFSVHSEANAILQCKDPFKIEMAFITASPCLQCTCLLLNTSCKTLIFDDYYPGWEISKDAWEKRGNLWMSYDQLLGTKGT